MIDERIAQRRADVRDEVRRGRLRRTVVLLVVLAVVAALVLVERSALVGLEEVLVTGTDRTSPDEIRDAAGLVLGTSTLRLRLREAEARVEALPLVRTATARRVDPLTVQVDVVERVPVAVARGGGQERLVDRDGVVLVEGTLDGLPRIQLPVVPPAVGQTAAALPALDNAMAAWRGLSGPLRAEVAVYEASGADELDLLLVDGTRVRFGRAARVDEKVRALGAVLGDLDGVTVEVIDVRAPSAPVIVGAP